MANTTQNPRESSKFFRSMRAEGRILGAALSYFTAFPVHAVFPSWSPTSQELSGCLRYFGLVGCAVGGWAYFCYVGAHFFWSHSVAGLFALTGGALATRAFHEDGLADFADALGGAFDRETAFKIMKDPRHGTFGVLALWSVMTLKWQLLVSVSEDLGTIFLALLTAHVLSRTGTWFLAALGNDARRVQSSEARVEAKSAVILQSPDDGPFQPATADLTPQGERCQSQQREFSTKVQGHHRAQEGLRAGFLQKGRAHLSGLVIHSFLVAGLMFLRPSEVSHAVMLGLLTVLQFHWGLKVWLGGYTGDCLGACQQVLEVVCFGIFAACVR